MMTIIVDKDNTTQSERQKIFFTTLRENLNKKLSREYAVRDFAIKQGAMVQQHRSNARIDLLQNLIDEFKLI